MKDGWPGGDLTWTCHVCGEERTDAMISVHKRKLRIGSVPVEENIRYCNDRQACIEGAKSATHLPGIRDKYPQEEEDEK